jgi:LysR family transcriptional regulator, low CO2-responsive transcriptional regulator
MTLITLRQIETLQAIASAGSLVAAADRLNMTPAALTARVKALEETVGLALFDRTPSGLRPNMAGEIALVAAHKIDNAVREFAEKLEQVRSGRSGRLSVGVVSTAKYFAPRLVAAFTRQNRDVDVRLQIGNRDEIVASLENFEVDVALTGRPPLAIPTEQHALGPHPYVMIAPPDHRLVGRRNLPRTELSGEAFLYREAGSGSRSLFENFIGDVHVRTAKIGIELGSNETIKQAVMAGLGIALISAHTIAAEVADGRLVVLDVSGLPVRRQWYVVHRTDRDLPPTALAFRDFARANCAGFLPVLK